MHLRDINGVYNVAETNESKRIGKYFTIVDRNKQGDAEMVIHKIMKTLVHSIRDNTDHDTEMYFQQYLSLHSKFSQEGYTLEAAVLDKTTFDHTTLTKFFSQPTYFDMSLNFGTDKSVDEFPSLPTMTTANPWEPTQPETKITLLRKSHQSVDD